MDIERKKQIVEMMLYEEEEAFYRSDLEGRVNPGGVSPTRVQKMQALRAELELLRGLK